MSLENWHKGTNVRAVYPLLRNKALVACLQLEGSDDPTDQAAARRLRVAADRFDAVLCAETIFDAMRPDDPRVYLELTDEERAPYEAAAKMLRGEL